MSWQKGDQVDRSNQQGDKHIAKLLWDGYTGK